MATAVVASAHLGGGASCQSRTVGPASTSACTIASAPRIPALRSGRSTSECRVYTSPSLSRHHNSITSRQPSSTNFSSRAGGLVVQRRKNKEVAVTCQSADYSTVNGNSSNGVYETLNGSATSGNGVYNKPVLTNPVLRKLELSDLVAAITSIPWDSPPKPWNEFWAIEPVSVVATRTDEALLIERFQKTDLRLPATKQEAWDRLKVNIVVYRQNYLVFLASLLLLNSVTKGFQALSLGLLLLGSSLACSSDKLLGWMALQINSRAGHDLLVYNAKVVAGRSRFQVINSLAAAATFILLFQRGNLLATTSKTLLYGGLLVALHGSSRPVNLRSAFQSFFSEVKQVKSSQELTRSIQSVLGRVWRYGKNKAPPSFTLRMNDQDKV